MLHLQVAAKKLDRRLAALGAIPLLERGLGDDQVTDMLRCAVAGSQPQLATAGSAHGCLEVANSTLIGVCAQSKS